MPSRFFVNRRAAMPLLLSTGVGGLALALHLHHRVDLPKHQVMRILQEVINEDAGIILTVGTYNVFWHCVVPGARTNDASGQQGHEGHRGASDLCLKNVSSTIDSLFKGAAFIGLQEASMHSRLQQESRTLRNMQCIAHEVSKDVIALFYNPSRYKLVWQEGGKISNEHTEPRPLLLAQFEGIHSQMQIVVIHLHNLHGSTDRRPIQEGICEIEERHRATLNKVFIPNSWIVCLGGWNDPEGRITRRFRPFGLCSQSKIKDVEVFCSPLPPRTCCVDASLHEMPCMGDYVLSNHRTSNSLGKRALEALASDHLPVLATLQWKRKKD